MSSSIIFDLTQKQYETVVSFLNDNNGKHIIKLLEKCRDEEYIPPVEKKIDIYEVCEGSAEEEDEYEVEVDSSGFCSLK